ncbi:MAG: endopeptidase La [Gammaproteobacteria bacterium]|nr:endopeptidase La [Gammaproteobacteria bacterium]MDE0226592.1 endopeptidase La [Gammaproteobacteria bacterium]
MFEVSQAPLPVLPLRDIVAFPHGVLSLFVSTESSILALEAALAGDKQILLVGKRDAECDNPGQRDLFGVGTSATVLQLLKLPDGTVKTLVEGVGRARIASVVGNGQYLVAQVEPEEEPLVESAMAEAVMRAVSSQFDAYVESAAHASKKVPPETVSSVFSIDEPGRLIDTIATQLPFKLEDRQAVLEAVGLDERMQRIIGLMEAEMALNRLEKNIRGRVKKQMEDSQREYYLNEKMKAIQQELGGEALPDEFEELRQKIDGAGMRNEAKDKAEHELAKLMRTPPMSPEATVIRGYLDWLLALPWKKRSRTRRDLRAAEEILEADHYGLEEVKERIVEYLAVQRRVGKVKGAVLCLVGPPGVGKTSLGESIARATNRKFVRMSLGGVRDEAEIRGHRRTYIGSMPGKILQKVAKVGVRNPLFLLDEVDKMGMDFRGDPASALLEVLDPEQNHTFNDHYLEVDYDLSDMFFVCTSNSMDIPPALLDRMEVIRLPGYTEDEKVNIASRFLVPKQKALNGLGSVDFGISERAIVELVRYYTREAGVRALEREIAKICRKVVKDETLGCEEIEPSIGREQIENYSGVRKFDYGRAEEENRVGVATGLAWTQVGGELLNIEAVAVSGKGRQTKTGSLGDVMQESIQAALTFVRSRVEDLGIEADFHEKNDIHIHVPEGATPKDGPSAGIGMCTALVSVLTGIPVRADVAMTGEITLRGQVLRIGGLKEKLLAAHRGGIRRVVIPEDNARDLKEVPDNVKAALDILPVKWMDEVIRAALAHPPAPRTESGPEPGSEPGSDMDRDVPFVRIDRRGDSAVDSVF